MLLIFSSQLHANPIPRRPFDAVYAFGDSFTDTGNTHSATGPSGFMFVSNLPYGRTFFHRPTNRYSDGRLVIDFLAHSLSLPFLPPYLDRNSDTSSGINFAVAGSTAIIHSFFAKNNMTLNITPQSIQTQLTWFNKFLESKGCRDSTTTAEQCAAVLGDALIWVGEIGANDYAYSFGSSFSRQTIQRLAIGSVTSFLQAILEKGAKYVVVQGLPPTGCLTLSLFLSSPDDRDDLGCVGTLNNLTISHNTALQAKIHLFRQKYPKSVIVYADYYNAYWKVMKNPRTYGFKELHKVCCGYGGGEYNFNYFNACGSPGSSSCADPFEYVNWDGVHLTEAMYRVMADAFVNGTFSDPPFSYLLWKKRQSG
ncbi:GDSL esterase/lipase-like [Dorcoceras hygrometricum]|uniref:GDSL esterase/lipase-like n=1 Tax=Dorcoceras hygrometricum TaxID=472368 RepID=A0A2Z7AZK3_9LAMI|nr:GDSL esterase/lipase-like [Dorcoceras hygrometricum]